MSIWSSLPAVGFEDPHEAPNGQVRSYATGWSNHYPTLDGTVERPAALHLADIPAWCAGGNDGDFESVGRWLRLGLHSHEHNFKAPSEVLGEVDATVVMDEHAVRLLATELTRWLERPKVSPTDPEHAR